MFFALMSHWLLLAVAFVRNNSLLHIVIGSEFQINPYVVIKRKA